MRAATARSGSRPPRTDGGDVAGGRGDVAEHGEVDRAVRARARRRCRRPARPWRRADQGAVPGGPHGQRRAPGDDQVGVGDQLGGQRGGEARRRCPATTASPRTARSPRRTVASSAPQESASASSSARARAGAAAGDEHRALRAGRAARRAPRPRRRRAGAAPRSRAGAGPAAARQRLDVERQVEHDGPALVAAGAVGAQRRRRPPTRPSAPARRPRRPRAPRRPGRCGSSSAPPRPRCPRPAPAAGCGSWPPR